jgi:hypothetical protein
MGGGWLQTMARTGSPSPPGGRMANRDYSVRAFVNRYPMPGTAST